MKAIFAFVLLVAGISALPPQHSNDVVTYGEQRFVTDAIAGALEELSQNIEDLGLDPLYIEHDVAAYALPVPVIFNGEAVVEEFLFHGLSNIIINDMDYSLILNRLRLDLSLPLIEATVKKADAEMTLFGKQYHASVAGRLAIKNVNVKAVVRVSRNIIGGISIRGIDINFRLGGIDSYVAVNLFGHDLSQHINKCLGTTIPNTLNEFEREVNQLLEIVLLDIINEAL